MAVLKNKTKSNFTIISNVVLRDTELSMKDRGVLCTICSLPDGWEFSIAGLSAIVPDGVDSIRTSIVHLEKLGYVKRRKARDKTGKYISEIEVFTERKRKPSMPDLPSRENRDGSTVTAKPTQYKKDNIRQEIKKDNNKSILLSEKENQKERKMEDILKYKNLIADNIKLESLLEIAKEHNSDEVKMVNEIYDVICDMVCYPRDAVTIKGTKYPWEIVKSRFLKLRYEHVASVLNRIIDADLKIKNMSSYLVSTLYNQSMIETMEVQASIHDEYLKQYRNEIY